MKNISFKILLFSSTIFLLSSCMMMGPGHHMTSSIETQQGHYDPVCGNHIDSIAKDLSLQYNDEIYFFHTNECMNKFTENPENYVITKNQRARDFLLWGLGGLGMTAMMLLMFL